MAEGEVFGIFGIKAIALVNRTTGVPYGRYRVLGGGEISISAEKINLMGGSQRFSWATEWGVYDSEISMTVREYPEFGFRMIAQGSSVITGNEAAGNVSAMSNKAGTSLAIGTTGISVATATAANLKTGQYTALVVGTGTVDIYYIGTESDTYEDSTLKITATPLVLGGGGDTASITTYGLTFTSRAVGSSALHIGDTATFEVRKINTGNDVIAIGRSAEAVQEFIAYLFGEDQKTGDQFYVEIPKCSASGLPIKFTEKEYSESELKLSFDYDTTKDYALKVYRITGSPSS